MSHPILDGLLIGAAAGAASNMVNRAMSPGQIQVHTITAGDGTVITVVMTRSGKFEMWAICARHTLLMGSYLNWVALQAGIAVWGEYFAAQAAEGTSTAGALGKWCAGNVVEAIEHQHELKRRWENHLAEQAAAKAAKRAKRWWRS
jgi:hypothetical protein